MATRQVIEQDRQSVATDQGTRIFTERDRAAIRTGFFTTLITLVAQFVLGISVNLFVTIPANHAGANPPDLLQSVFWAILHGPIVLVLHVILGLLMVASGFGLIARLVLMRAPRRLTVAAVIGAISLLFAAGSGAGFVTYHEDFDSMLMASFFAVAVVSYLYGLYDSAGNPVSRT